MANKRMFCSDIEGNGLLDEIDEVWCASFQEMTPSLAVLGPMKSVVEYDEMRAMYGNPDHIMVMHNGIAFDKAALEKVLKFEVKAEIIDTLFLSWYLYPKLVRHGLAYWGELLGVSKPEIDDWENLSLKEYIHRCEEDVKIQTLLWQQIWKHLILLYGNPQGAWHAVRHLNFKATQAAQQEKSRWKLNVEQCKIDYDGYVERHGLAIVDLEKVMPKVPVKAKKTRPKKCFKANGKLSALGAKWQALVVENLDKAEYAGIRPVDYDGMLEIVTKYKPPNAASSSQIKKWLFSLGWVPETFKYVRNKQTNEVKIIPQVKNADTGLLCDSIIRLAEQFPALKHLEDMSIEKHRASICNTFLANVDDDGFVVAAIQGLTNTLRFKHKVCLNLPSVRKKYGANIRGLLIARNDNMELCGSDMSSLEDRTKQHYMWKHDPEYVTDMQKPGFDPHLDMASAAGMISPAEIAFYKSFDKDTATDEDKERYHHLAMVRHAGKGTNYAATYGARGPTIARSAGVEEDVGEQLYDAYWKRNWALTAIADECITKNSRGMKWLWNPVANMWFYLKADKDKFSTLNQSTGTYAFDRWVWHIMQKRKQLTGQFHDEVILEVKKGFRPQVTKILKDAVASVNEELKLNRDLDCDVDFGKSYAEIH